MHQGSPLLPRPLILRCLSLLHIFTQSFLSLILFLLADIECFLLSDDDNPKKDAAAVPFFGASTIPEGHPQEEAVVVKPSVVLHKKNTPAPASKRPKRAAVVATSLEVHQPPASSDSVSFCFLYLTFFVLCILYSHSTLFYRL
jgi:hypothetical protein